MNDSKLDSRETLDLNRYLLAVWRAKWLLLLLVLLAASAAAFRGFSRPLQFTATALLEIGRVWDKPVEDLYTTSEVAGSPAFLTQLTEQDGRRALALQRRVAVETISVGPRRDRYAALVQVRATGDSPDDAEGLARRVADAIIARHDKLFAEAIAPHLERQQQLEAQAREMAAQAAPAARDLQFRLEGELAGVRAKNTSSAMTEKTHMIGPVVVDQGTRPSPWRAAAAAALLALCAGLAAVVLFSHLRGIGSARAAGSTH